MFMTWVNALVGRLKSDYSISPALAYFPIPFPVPDDRLRGQLDAAIEQIFAVRKKYSTSSLADLYGPTSMPADLLEAHTALDRVVDRAFGVRSGKPADADRRKTLISRYNAAI